MWRNAAGVAVSSLFCLGTVLHAQTQRAEVPPIPVQERFVLRNDLAATLRLTTSRVQIDELPKATLILKNVGTRRFRIRRPTPDDIVHPNPHVRVYTGSGDRLHGSVSMCRCIPMLASIREMILLEPQQEYEVQLRVPRVATVPAFSGVWHVAAQSSGLPPGDYFVRGVYANMPEMHPVYDVYEPGADEVWEGQIESPPVRYTVLPPDEARLRDLTLTITGPGNADSAIRAVGLARASSAAAALVRRFQSDRTSRLRILAALLEIADSDATDRLFDWLESLPEQTRNAAAFSDSLASEPLSLLARTSSGCRGARHIDYTWNREDFPEAIQSFVKRCPQHASEARAAIRAPDDPALSRAAFQDALNRRQSALWRLGTIGDPADIPLLVSVARGEQPSLLQGPDRKAASTHLANAAAGTLRTIAWTRVRRVLREELPELIGNIPREIYISDVNNAFDRLPREGLQTLVPELMAATRTAVVNSANALRAAYLAQRSERDPSKPVIDLTNATVGEATGRLSDRRTDVQAAALEFLIEHGNSSLSTHFVKLVDSPDGRVRELAIRAIERFGTASAFAPLRQALVLRPDEIASSVDTALRALTFVEEFRGPDRPPAEEWDTWWRRNRHFTRQQWAEHVIAEVQPDPLGWHETLAARAVEYLANLPNPPHATLERAARSSSWVVRVAAAAGIGRHHLLRGMQLLQRELGNRSYSACVAAATALQTLSSVPHGFDCSDPIQRQRARDFWAEQIAAASTSTPPRRN